MYEIVTTVPPDLDALGALPSRPGLDVDVLDRRRSGRIHLLLKLLKEARRRDVVLLNGSGRLDQIAAALIRRTAGGARLVISDSTWDRGSNVFDRLLCSLGIRALDGPNVRYCVLSTHEVTSFADQWRVDPARITYTPFCHTLTEDELAKPLRDGNGIFAGGDSMRDYVPLLRAVGELGTPLVLAVRHPTELGPVPPNVHAESVPPSRFLELMRDAHVVVVPLRAGIGRSAGQQTYLNAMALGKVVVVTDSPGARDYVTDRMDGLVVPPGDADALVHALRWIDDPQNTEAVQALRSRAVRTARERFSPGRHFAALLEVVAQEVEAPAARGRAVA